MSGRIATPDLASLYREAGERWGGRPSFSTRQSDGSFRSVSYRSWRDRALALAEALIELGVGARDHVAILSDNRFEWILADAAILFCGAADVPRAADIMPGEISYILDHADVEVAFVENESVLRKVEPLLSHVTRIRHLIVMDPLFGTRDAGGKILRLADLEDHGAMLREGGSRRAEERIDGVLPDDLFTIIYTSGTTGTPKGVQLTHAAMASQVRNLPFDLSPSDRALSILPVWHSFERVFEVISIAAGLETCYTSLRNLGEDLKNVRPSIMASAPRLWEGLYQRIMTGVGKASPLRRTLFRAARLSAAAVRSAKSFFTGQQIDLKGRSLIVSAGLALRHAVSCVIFILPSLLLDRIVLSKLRATVGGRLRGTISGGGALPPHVDAFFNDIGIPVLEGYGLTESCPVLAVRTWGRLVIGTVGPAFPETVIRIVDPASGRILYPDSRIRGSGRGLVGEIHARGPQIMKGYYKDPEGTARVLRDEWLATGDLGVMTFNDCLKIVGRCKETIVLLGGENVEPLPIESKLLESPLIDQCMVVGQDQKHLGVLVVPSVGGFAAMGIAAGNVGELSASPQARELIQSEIRRLVCAANGFKPFERIVAVDLIGKPFEVGDELTQTFKLRRHVITEKYVHHIGQMFGIGPNS
jgi:long-chain acyl-CoA synthetase